MAYDETKLTRLSHLKSLAEIVKSGYATKLTVSNLENRLNDIVASGGEPNTINKILVNGTEQAISEDKAVNITVPTEAEIEQAITTAVEAANHATFVQADAVPEASAAQKNVFYLVLNEETGFYDIWALIGDEVVRLDDTSVTLDGYVTVDALNEVMAMRDNLYTAEKTDLTASDDSVITAYFNANAKIVPYKGDVFVIKSIVDDVEYESSSYQYDGAKWVAITGNVDADKVIARGTLMLAGNYTQLGNWTKTQNGTVEKNVDGKSIMAILREITSQRLQPKITANPSVSGFSLNNAGAVEAGTTIDSASFTAASLNAGSYTYGPDTGVTASNWKVSRVTNLATTQIIDTNGTSLAAGSDNNDGNGFIIGDEGGTNVVSSLKYKVVATHSGGVQAEDNLGDPSDPAVAIASGTKTKETSAYTPYRNYFYGATADKPTVDSTYVRGLTPSNAAYAAGEIVIEVAAGSQRVAIACLADKTGVTKIINETAMNADVTETFNESTVNVEGVNGYTAKSYKIWVYEPAKPYESAATLRVTLG